MQLSIKNNTPFFLSEAKKANNITYRILMHCDVGPDIALLNFSLPAMTEKRHRLNALLANRKLANKAGELDSVVSGQ